VLLSSTKSTLFKLLAPVYSRVNHVIAGVEFTVKCLDFNLMLNSCYRNVSGSLQQELQHSAIFSCTFFIARV